MIGFVNQELINQARAVSDGSMTIFGFFVKLQALTSDSASLRLKVRAALVVWQ
jgi:hypothetical protein